MTINISLASAGFGNTQSGIGMQFSVLLNKAGFWAVAMTCTESSINALDWEGTGGDRRHVVSMLE